MNDCTDTRKLLMGTDPSDGGAKIVFCKVLETPALPTTS